MVQDNGITSPDVEVVDVSEERDGAVLGSVIEGKDDPEGEARIEALTIATRAISVTGDHNSG